MNTTVIKSNQSIAPFWGDKLSFIGGLDPLGLQNSSDATFSLMLPGLNNVTGRIRYYSFYCWLLDQFSIVVKNKTAFEQQKFIRRAEYIVALGSQYFSGGYSSIPGSNYAIQEIKQNELTEHDLQAATFKDDGSTRDTYWNYSLGAFGQYYLGSLRDIGLIIEREKGARLYVRTSKQNEDHISGEELAIAFDENLSKKSKAIFLECLVSGTISEKQLLKLLPSFELNVVPTKSKEQELLIELLKQKDYPFRIEDIPTTYRKETMLQLLRYAQIVNKDFNDRDFVLDAYLEKGIISNDRNSCFTGWYFYQLNEYWQFANTSMLNGCLSELLEEYGPRQAYLPDFVESLTKKTITVLVENKILDNKDISIQTLLDKIENSFDSNGLIEAIEANSNCNKTAYALIAILTVYNENKEEFVQLDQYIENYEIAKDGEPTKYFNTEFKERLDSSIHDFLYDYLFTRIIYRHQYVAFRKIGGGSRSSQKFIIEDLKIRYINNFDASFTGPRINTLLNYLMDLSVINENKQLTSRGKQLLSKLEEDAK